jgi:hypothetical protein
MSDSTTQNATATATWISSSANVASVTSGGLVTALANGTTTITATYQGRSDTIVITVAMKATPQLTTVFKRLCGPFRTSMDVTLSETSGNIGFTVTAVTVHITDFYNIQRLYKVYVGTEIAAFFGASHFNASQTLVGSVTTSWGVGTQDANGTVTVSVTDDAGNATTLSQSPNQRDRC